MNKDRCLLLNKLIINNIYCIFFVFCFIRLLSDAEFGKDIPKNLVRQDYTATGNLSDMSDNLPDFLAQKVGGQSGAKPMQGLPESFMCNG